MKKMLQFFLACIMSLSFCACNNGEKKDSSKLPTVSGESTNEEVNDDIDENDTIKEGLTDEEKLGIKDIPTPEAPKITVEEATSQLEKFNVDMNIRNTNLLELCSSDDYISQKYELTNSYVEHKFPYKVTYNDVPMTAVSMKYLNTVYGGLKPVDDPDSILYSDFKLSTETVYGSFSVPVAVELKYSFEDTGLTEDISKSAMNILTEVLGNEKYAEYIVYGAEANDYNKVFSLDNSIDCYMGRYIKDKSIYYVFEFTHNCRYGVTGYQHINHDGFESLEKVYDICDFYPMLNDLYTNNCGNTLKGLLHIPDYASIDTCPIYSTCSTVSPTKNKYHCSSDFAYRGEGYESEVEFQGSITQEDNKIIEAKLKAEFYANLFATREDAVNSIDGIIHGVFSGIIDESTVLDLAVSKSDEDVYYCTITNANILGYKKDIEVRIDVFFREEEMWYAYFTLE